MIETLLRKFKLPLAVVGIGVLALIALYNQPYYPTTWFDEGLALQGAMNLALHGKYAMLSVEGFRVLDQPLIANGPGIVLPLTAMFLVFGIGLLQARLLAAVFFVLATWLFYRFTSRLFSAAAALISLVVLFTVPLEGYIIYGRQALGNVSGLVYFFAGCLFFIKLCERKSTRYAIASGLMFGLALITKGQYILLLPVWGLVILADALYYKQLGLRNGIVLLGTIVVCLVLWQLAQFTLVGAENYPAHLEAIRSSSRVTVFTFQPSRYGQSLWYLIRSGFPIFILPALSIAAFESRARDGTGLVKFFLVVFVAVWVAWYLFASIGWNRYMFEAYAVGSILTGHAILKVKDSFFLLKDKFPNVARFGSLYRIAVYLFLTIVILFSAFGFQIQLRNILTYRSFSAFEFADYINSHVPQGAVIESWEWEIDALAPSLTYHHPTNDWVDKKTAEIHFGDIIAEQYDLFEYQPAYLIDGPFSKWTRMYGEAISEGCCVEIFTAGGYTLYRVEASK
jgi:4-amino-4-deoxy-L-arabinose transferase-like glycosyltransferase